MLARPNRLLTADDFRSTIRRGRRSAGPLLVAHVNRTGIDRPARFGFITAGSVGNAVTRNRLRRQLRAICRELLPGMPRGTDVVIRMLPESARADWTTLRGEVVGVLSRSA